MRESYVRYCWSITGLEISVGLQWNAGEEVRDLWRGLRDLIAPVLAECRFAETGHMTLEIEAALRSVHPSRAYFIEVSDGDEKWTQVYDPRDYVKTRCTCPCTRHPWFANDLGPAS